MWTKRAQGARSSARDDARGGGLVHRRTMIETGRQPRAPSMLDAVLPVVVLIVLLALTIWLFGVSATDGPLQVALLLGAAFASLMALKNGYTTAAVADAAIGGVTTAMSAIFILLAVGALIGTWNMAGTIPTVVDYGGRVAEPADFFLPDPGELRRG